MCVIAIIEDSDNDAEVLTGYISKYSKEYGHDFSVTRFKNVAEFLNGYNAIWVFKVQQLLSCKSEICQRRKGIGFKDRR